ncbi:hypothetical protein S83_066722, partial [Arachis hypogaea]
RYFSSVILNITCQLVYSSTKNHDFELILWLMGSSLLMEAAGLLAVPMIIAPPVILFSFASARFA